MPVLLGDRIRPFSKSWIRIRSDLGTAALCLEHDIEDRVRGVLRGVPTLAQDPGVLGTRCKQ